MVLMGEDKKPEVNFTGSGQQQLEKHVKKDRISVGQWVKYQVKRYRKEQMNSTPVALAEAVIKISVVSREVVLQNEYFWVELAINEGRSNQRIVKMLMDKSSNPQAERLVLKYEKLPAVEVPLRVWEVKSRITREMLLDEMTANLYIIPFVRILFPEAFDESSVSYESLPVTFPSKEFFSLSCIRVALKQPGASAPDGFVWYSDKLPMAGLVQFMFDDGKFRTVILAQDYDYTGARSLITEVPVKLDFREQERQPASGATEGR
jgi:hypothetical protein